MARTAFLSVPIAAFLTATGGTDFEPDGVQATVAAVYVIGLVALGVLGGWRALPLFALVYTAAAAVHEVFFWVDDPSSSGLDDMSPMVGLMVVLPFTLPLIAIGALVARIARRHERYPRRA